MEKKKKNGCLGSDGHISSPSHCLPNVKAGDSLKRAWNATPANENVAGRGRGVKHCYRWFSYKPKRYLYFRGLFVTIFGRCCEKRYNCFTMELDLLILYFSTSIPCRQKEDRMLAKVFSDQVRMSVCDPQQPAHPGRLREEAVGGRWLLRRGECRKTRLVH